MTNEVKVAPPGYTWGADGRLAISQEARDEAAALYYSQRLAYQSNDTRHPIGRYNSRGEVERFKSWAE